jgi:hypothetical protein
MVSGLLPRIEGRLRLAVFGRGGGEVSSVCLASFAVASPSFASEPKDSGTKTGGIASPPFFVLKAAAKQ